MCRTEKPNEVQNYGKLAVATAEEGAAVGPTHRINGRFTQHTQYQGAVIANHEWADQYLAC